MSEHDTTADTITTLWAEARIAWADGAFPKYGTREWAALGPDDPRRIASMAAAAEMWRKYGDEDELLAWFRSTSGGPNLRAKAPAPYQPNAVHKLRATPGWPPIAVPGHPGKFLSVDFGRAA